MQKPELKDYNLDENIIKHAERIFSIFSHLWFYLEIFLVLIFAFFFIKYMPYVDNLHSSSEIFKIIIVVFAPLICFFGLGLSAESVSKFLLPKHATILNKYKKYKSDLSSYLCNQKQELEKNYSIKSIHSNIKTTKETKQTIKKPAYKTNTKEPTLPNTEAKNEIFSEGKKSTVKLTKYERNAIARKKCIEHYGCKCYICEVSLEYEYGNIAEGFIHVHHIKPISEIGKAYEVDPVKDLIPICPNCHSVIHTKNPPYTIAEMKKKMQEMRRKQ